MPMYKFKVSHSDVTAIPNRFASLRFPLLPSPLQRTLLYDRRVVGDNFFEMHKATADLV